MVQVIRPTLITMVTALAAFSMQGCAVNERTKPISNVYLEDRDVTATDDSLPFNHAWIDPSIKPGDYTKVFFRSVTIDKLAKNSWKDSSSTYITSEQDFTKEATLLADYCKSQFNDEVISRKDAPITVTDHAGPHTLVFDMALTELEFSHPLPNAGAMLVPVPGSAMLFSTISNPHSAIAGRVYNGATGKLIATFADRKYPPTRFLDFNKITATSPNREICIYWAEEIADALEREDFGKVSSRGIFKLLPW